MYLSLSDRPAKAARTSPDATRRVTTPASGRRVARVVVTLGMVSLLTDVSSESVSAILPLYLTVGLGLSPMAYGVVDGLNQGVSALVRVAAGWAADRWDRPMPVALSGYGLSMLARVLLPFAGGLGSVSAAISADRIGKGIRTAPRDAMIAAATPPERLGRAFGVHRTLDTVGAAIGPLLAFVILWQIPDGYRTVMVVSLGFAILGVAALALFVPWRSGARHPDEPDKPEAPHREKIDRRHGRRWREVATPGLRRTLVVAGVLGLLTVGDGFIYLALLDHGGFAAQWFPVLFVGTNLAYLALAVPLGRLADRVGRIRVLVLGHLPLAGAYLCASVGPSIGPGGLATTAVALLLLGLFYAATDGVLAAVSGRLVPVHVRASGIAAAQTTVAAARMGASFGFGALWYSLGQRDAMLCVCAALLAAIPLGYAALRDLRAAA